MKVLCVLGFVLLMMLKIVLLPVRVLLGLLDLSLEFVGRIVCRIGEIFGTIFFLIVVISRIWGDVSNKAFLEGLIFAVLIAVIPRASYILGGSLIAGIQGLLRRIPRPFIFLLQKNRER